MLRFIIKRTAFCGYNQMHSEEFYTIDADADTQALELALTSGGYDENSFERHEMIGVEIIKESTEL